MRKYQFKKFFREPQKCEIMKLQSYTIDNNSECNKYLEIKGKLKKLLENIVEYF